MVTEPIAVECEGQGRESVKLELRAQGRDFLVLIGGGEDHVGAVAVASPEKIEMMVIPPHKEGPLAQTAAQMVAQKSGRNCVAVAGIHQDNITSGEIQAVLRNFHVALERLVTRVFPSQDKGEHE